MACLIGVASLVATSFCVGPYNLKGLTSLDREVLKKYECCGRYAFVWFDCDGNTHISMINGGTNIKSALPGCYTGCTLDGGTIELTKSGCNCYCLNGVPVEVRNIDCNAWHVYLIPVN